MNVEECALCRGVEYPTRKVCTGCLPVNTGNLHGTTDEPINLLVLAPEGWEPGESVLDYLGRHPPAAWRLGDGERLLGQGPKRVER